MLKTYTHLYLQISLADKTSWIAVDGDVHVGANHGGRMRVTALIADSIPKFLRCQRRSRCTLNWPGWKIRKMAISNILSRRVRVRRDDDEEEEVDLSNVSGSEEDGSEDGEEFDETDDNELHDDGSSDDQSDMVWTCTFSRMARD